MRHDLRARRDPQPRIDIELWPEENIEEDVCPHCGEVLGSAPALRAHLRGECHLYDSRVEQRIEAQRKSRMN